MPKLNLYRVNKQREAALLERASEAGLTELSRRSVDGFEIIWLFSSGGTCADIPWLDLFAGVLPAGSHPQNLFHFGMILFTTPTLCYALSMGKSHFYLKDYCDSDFGITLGERISDGTAKQKCSRLFGSTGTSAILSYRDGTDLDYQPGEALEHLKGGTIDSDEWGKTASFGQSYQTHLPKTVEGIPALIRQIETTLAAPARQPLPRLELVSDDATKEALDAELGQAIAQGTNAVLQFQQTQVVGVSFVFLDEASYELCHGRHRQPVDGEPTLDDLRQFAAARGLTRPDQWGSIRVRVTPEEGKQYSKPIRDMIEYVNPDRYLLYRGKWHRFDQNYLTLLTDGIDQRVVFDSADLVDFPQAEYDVWKTNADLDPTREHREEFIIERMHGAGHSLLHKRPFAAGRFSQELADLYHGGALIFIKAGLTKTLGAVITQSKRTIALLRNRTAQPLLDEWKTQGLIGEVREMCLLLLMERASQITALSQIRSLAFLIELADWQRQCVDAGFAPRVRVGYYQPAPGQAQE